MSVIKRKKRDKAFTIIDTATLRRNDLSLKAKGLLTLMMSFPEDWEFTMVHIAQSTLEGRESLQTTMKELVSKGYVVRKRRRNETNQFSGWEYEVDDTPQTLEITPITGEADKRESRQSGMPTVGKPATTNKDFTYKEKTNTNIRPEASLSPNGDTQALGAMPLKKQCQQVIDVWNQHRGILPAANLTPTRQKTLERLIKTYGLTELETLVGKAAQFVAKSDFWQERKYGFDNLLSKEKFVQHAESYDVEFPQSKAACSAAKFDPASLQPGVTVENLQGRRGVVVEVRETLVVVRVGTMCVNWPLEAVKGVL